MVSKMDEQEKRRILDEARANANSPREYISPERLAEARERRREERAAFRQIARECEIAYTSWTAREPAQSATPTNSASTWEQWIEQKLAEQREAIYEAVGTALAEFVAEERRSVRSELFAEAHKLRSELAHERAEDLRQMKIQNANLQETLRKMQREVSREARGEELPASRMN
jgi:hypothetical protein